MAPRDPARLDAGSWVIQGHRTKVGDQATCSTKLRELDPPRVITHCLKLRNKERVDVPVLRGWFQVTRPTIREMALGEMAHILGDVSRW